MSRPRPLCFGLVVPAVIALALGGAHVVAAPVVLENVTPSLPLGFYRHVAGDVRPDVVVAVRQPALARDYLRSLGFPSGALLLKRVVATTGAEVCARQGDVVVGGLRFARETHDGQGRPLPLWRDCRRLGAGEVFLKGDGARSFDSRYFGPVPSSFIVGRYEALR